MSACLYYQEIGAGVCDGCGKRAKEHEGIQCLRKGASPFGGANWEYLSWAEWDERLAASQRVAEARAKLAALTDEQVVALVEGVEALTPAVAVRSEAGADDD